VKNLTRLWVALKRAVLVNYGHFRWNRGDGAVFASEIVLCSREVRVGGARACYPLYRFQYRLVSEAKRTSITVGIESTCNYTFTASYSLLKVISRGLFSIFWNNLEALLRLDPI